MAGPAALAMSVLATCRIFVREGPAATASSLTTRISLPKHRRRWARSTLRSSTAIRVASRRPSRLTGSAPRSLPAVTLASEIRPSGPSVR